MSIEAMKRWLEAFKWASDKTEPQANSHCLCPICKSIDELSQAIEQTQKPEGHQEPVVYDKTELNHFAQDLYDQKMREGKHGHYESMFHVIHQCIKKVASPQRQPLTDEQKLALLKKHFNAVIVPDWFDALLKDIEAAHGIKGEA